MSDLETHEIPAAVNPETWTLRVTGAVEQPLQLSPADLETFPLETAADEFACVEGWVAEGLSWRGVRVGTVLDRADPNPSSEYGLVRAMDGDYACSFPLERLSESLLALELDGEPLPVEHGGPARLVPTGAGRECWESVKWVSRIVLGETPLSAADTAAERALSRLE